MAHQLPPLWAWRSSPRPQDGGVSTQSWPGGLPTGRVPSLQAAGKGRRCQPGLRRAGTAQTGTAAQAHAGEEDSQGDFGHRQVDREEAVSPPPPPRNRGPPGGVAKAAADQGQQGPAGGAGGPWLLWRTPSPSLSSLNANDSTDCLATSVLFGRGEWGHRSAPLPVPESGQGR